MLRGAHRLACSAAGITAARPILRFLRKIPAAQRGLLPVIVDEAGILGVCGIGPDTGRLAQEGFPAIRICIEQTEK